MRRMTPLRRRALGGAVRARQLTASRRVLPDFLVIGASRSGTSTLFSMLRDHPDIVAPLRKEIGWFSATRTQPESWYRAHFPARAALRARQLARGRAPLTFEATPGYIFYPHADRRIVDTLPEAKIVAMVRDPLRRALSQHRHLTRHGEEHLDFVTALRREEERTAEGLRRMREDPDHHDRAAIAHSYIARSCYGEQLSRWVELISTARLHVIVSEHFFADPQGTLQRLVDFLGVARHEVAGRNASYASGGGQRTEPQVELPEDLAATIMPRLRDDVARLRACVDIDPPWALG